MNEIYLTEITEIGPDVAGLLVEAGTLITFEVGAPPELAELSVLHRRERSREEPPGPGDVLYIGSEGFGITAVGSKCWENMLKLGHASFKFNDAEEAELPGEICLQSAGAEGVRDLLKPGARLSIESVQSAQEEERG